MEGPHIAPILILHHYNFGVASNSSGLITYFQRWSLFLKNNFQMLYPCTKIKQMKVKWRAHEHFLVTSMTMLSIGILTAQYFTRPHFLLPKAGSLLLLYLAYL